MDGYLQSNKHTSIVFNDYFVGIYSREYVVNTDCRSGLHETNEMLRGVNVTWRESIRISINICIKSKLSMEFYRIFERKLDV